MKHHGLPILLRRPGVWRADFHASINCPARHRKNGVGARDYERFLKPAIDDQFCCSGFAAKD